MAESKLQQVAEKR